MFARNLTVCELGSLYLRYFFLQRLVWQTFCTSIAAVAVMFSVPSLL